MGEAAVPSQSTWEDVVGGLPRVWVRGGGRSGLESGGVLQGPEPEPRQGLRWGHCCQLPVPPVRLWWARCGPLGFGQAEL